LGSTLLHRYRPPAYSRELHAGSGQLARGYGRRAGPARDPRALAASRRRVLRRTDRVPAPRNVSVRTRAEGRKPMKRSSIVSLLCLLAAPAFAAPADDALAHSKAFERPANARDPKAILTLYADDAHVVWPGKGDKAKR